MKTEYPRFYLWGHKAEVTSVRFSSEGKILKSTDKQGKTFYWKLKTGQPIAKPTKAQLLPPNLRGPNGKCRVEISENRIRVFAIRDLYPVPKQAPKK
ncbi:MAG: hypothetical protein ACFCD0_23755 [Gemmataceae bacterium]